MLNRKIVLVFISFIFVCLLSTSMVCAADNTTQTDDINIDDSDSSGVDSSITANTNSKPGTLTDFRNDIVDNKGNLSLNRDYELVVESDSDYINQGIFLNESDVSIEGNNHTINIHGLSRLFDAYNSTIEIKNLNIKNTNGSAIRLVNSNLTTSHVNFQNDDAVESCSVLAIGSIYNSSSDSFTNLKSEWGSAIQAASGSSVIIANATFNITQMQKWGSIYVSDSECIVSNTTFENMKSKYVAVESEVAFF